MRNFKLVLAALLVLFQFGCGKNQAANQVKTLSELKEEAVEKGTPELCGVSEYVKIAAADFNNGTKPNNLGEDFGSWNKDPQDTTQGCKESFAQDNFDGNAGYSIKLKYDVDSPNPAYNGFWMKLGGIDLKKFNNLIFYVKGDQQDDFTKNIKIELKSPAGKGEYIVTGIDEIWQKMVIPLAGLKGLADLSNVQELVIVFDDINATKKSGTIYIDEIYFDNL